MSEGLLFADLDAEAQATAIKREQERELYDQWWDSVYEDATRMGALLGIRVDEISFSGFWSQGDGASYIGRYEAMSDAVEKVKAECNDEELLRIAQELTVLQVAYGLMYEGSSIDVAISRDRSNYSHEYTMNFKLSDSANSELTPQGPQPESLVKLLRDFARWVYKQLEAEYEYLTSEEYARESLSNSGLLFSADGRII